MSKFIPLISSGIAGPLGVLHLPRLWQKISLESLGKLADGYPGIGPGFDSMVINGLGLTPEAVQGYISGNKPSYPQFESWVASQPGAKLDKSSVQKLNLAIKGYIHDDETRKQILSECGLADDGSVNPDAISLNNLEDWNLFYEAELK
jgi:hypothetical protein